MTSSATPRRSLETRRGSYVDSVTLMQVSKRVGSLPGVRSALVAMATDLNLDLAVGMGFEPPAGVSPNEMIVALEADNDEALDAARAEVDAALTEAASPAPTAFGAAPPPATVAAAARGLDPDSTVALVSTPGQYAFADALDAVDAGLLTMVFSDNVPLAQEVALKDRAAEQGVLVMGPDCGTAVVGGVGLGFANVVPVLFSAAAQVPGVTPAHGIAAVSGLGYLGMMAGPPVVGVIAESTSLGWGLATVVLFALALALSARRALPRAR